MYAQEVSQKQVNVDYEYVQKATENNNVLIIDVREPEEVKEHGKIPNSVNIPCELPLMMYNIFLFTSGTTIILVFLLPNY